MLNRVLYQGRLTKDIELRYTQSGVAYCNFTVAWSETYKEIETKCFLNCKAWRGAAETLANYFHKGKEIIVEGRLNTEEWEQDGEKRSRTVLSVDKVHFCGKKEGAPAQASGQASGSALPNGSDWAAEANNDDDLPF